MRSKQWLISLTIGIGLTGCDALGLGGSDDSPAQPLGQPSGPDDNAYAEAGRPPSDGGPGFSNGMFPSAPWPARLAGSPVRSARQLPSISGGTLAVSPDGAYAVVSDPDRDLLQVLRLADRSLSTVALEPGSEPGRVSFDAAGFAHVVLRNAGSVGRLNLATPALLTATKVCELPRGVSYLKGEDALAVSCASGDLVRLRASDHGELSRRFIDTDLRDVVVTSKGKLFVSRYRSAELLAINASGGVAARRRPIDRKGISFDPNLGSMKETTMKPALSWRAVPDNDGKVLLLHQRAQEEEVVTSSPGGYGGFGNCTAISHAGLSTMNETGDTGASYSLSGVALAVDLALSPDSQWLAVASPSGYLNGLSTLTVYSTTQPVSPPGGGFGFLDGPMGADAGVGPADAGPALDPNADGCSFAVQFDGADSQVTAVAFTPDGRLITQSREPAQLDFYELTSTPADYEGGVPFTYFASTDTLSLSNESVRDTGHDLFHADVGGGITCASCHGEGTDDGHVWNFEGIGPRRTQNMRGGLKGTAPFHWDGDMLSFQHLVDAVMTGRMRGFEVPPTFGAALFSWIDAQPALRMPVSNAAAAARGRLIFESRETACATCHSGTTTTNNGTFDVGTGGAFQVPSLIGLGLRAPYMHDGCATTLRDRFTSSCGGKQHGNVSQLSSRELDDLVSYLQGL